MFYNVKLKYIVHFKNKCKNLANNKVTLYATIYIKMQAMPQAFFVQIFTEPQLSQ